MTLLIIGLVGALIFAYIGWWYETRIRKKIIKEIKQDLQAEINWLKLNHYQDTRAYKVDTFKEAIDIVNQYDF